MKLEVLVAAMNQKDDSLIKKMNLRTNAIIGNQSDQNNYKIIKKGKYEYKYITLKERGVGQNRNTILFRATGDILTFADDDMIFVDNYEDIILNAFKEIPKADAIIFNINTDGIQVGRRINTKIKRIHYWNYMNYGAARISVKNKSIRKANICFSREFGGGTNFSSGEDTLFIHDMLKKKLKIYVYPVTIGTVDQNSSTWFKGYTEKYYYDKGVFFCALVGKFKAYILTTLMILKHWKSNNQKLKLSEALKQTYIGVKNYETLTPYEKRKEEK